MILSKIPDFSKIKISQLLIIESFLHLKGMPGSRQKSVNIYSLSNFVYENKHRFISSKLNESFIKIKTSQDIPSPVSDYNPKPPVIMRSPIKVPHNFSQPRVLSIPNRYKAALNSPIHCKENPKVRVISKVKLNKTMRDPTSESRIQGYDYSKSQRKISRTQFKTPKNPQRKGFDYFGESEKCMISRPSNYETKLEELFRNTAKEFSSFSAIRIQGLLTKKWCEYKGRFRIVSGITPKMNERIKRLVGP